MSEPTTDFEPRITAFVCNWCTYTGADLAGTSRMHMASNVRIIRLPCTGRIDALFVIKALEHGADGIIVSGCHPADCHYTAGNYHARRRFIVFRELMNFMGINPDRITFSWVSAGEGGKWRDVVNETVTRVRALGPFDAYHELAERPSPGSAVEIGVPIPEVPEPSRSTASEDASSPSAAGEDASPAPTSAGGES